MAVHIVFSCLFFSLFSVTFMGGLSKVLLASTSLEYLVHPVSFCWAVWNNSGINHCYISLVVAIWSSGSFLSWCHFPIPLEKATTAARSLVRKLPELRHQCWNSRFDWYLFFLRLQKCRENIEHTDTFMKLYHCQREHWVGKLFVFS